MIFLECCVDVFVYCVFYDVLVNGICVGLIEFVVFILK